MPEQIAIPIRHDALRAAGSMRVWDLGIRLFHWSLVLCVAVALITGFLAPANWIDVHVVAGSVIAALIVYRLVWGFLGSTYARFGSFVVGPRVAMQHASELLRGRAHRHIGHNPVGTMMILALLATLIGLTISGTLTLGGVLKEGPLAAITTYATGRTVKEIHELLAFGVVGLIALHVAGIVIESLRTRESLVGSMITGRKRADASDQAAPSARSHPIAATLLSVVVLTGASAGIWQLSNRPALGVPTRPLDPLYVKECGACHTPHHPSLAPAATWQAIMARLDDHFGDNASLEPAPVAKLLAFLTNNASETSDTKAANRLRAADPAGSPRITETPGWRRLHRPVDAAAFKNKKVAGKLNCAACHADAATGLFHPRSIAIPQEK